MITTNATFDARIDDQGIDPVVLIEIGGNTNWLFSTRQLVSGQGSHDGYSYSDYDPIIVDVSDIDYSLPDSLAGVANISDCLVFINNVNPVKSNSAAKMLTAATIAFHDNSPSADTITDSGSGFITAGFEDGDKITVTGTTNNNDTYTIDTAAAGTITLIAGDSLTNESAGTAFSLSWNIENQSVVIKQGFMKNTAGADFTLSNFVKAFEGIVEDYSWNEQEMTITVKDASSKRHKLLPQTPVQSSVAHSKINGLLIPITYGDWDYARGLLVDNTLGSQKYQFDTNGLKAMTSLFCYDKDFDYFVPVSSLREDQSAGHEYVFTAASGWAVFNDATNPFAEQGLILLRDILEVDSTIDNTSHTTGSGGRNFGTENPDNAFDGNTSTYAMLHLDSHDMGFDPTPSDYYPRTLIVHSGRYTSWAHAEYRIVQVTSLGEIRKVGLVGKITVPNYTPSTEIYVWVQLNPSAETPESFLSGGYSSYPGEINILDNITFDNLSAPDFTIDLTNMLISSAKIYNSDANTRWQKAGWGTLNNGRLVFGGFRNGGAGITPGTYYCKIYEAKLLALSTLKFDETPYMYCELEGRPFGSGWTGKTSTNLVEKPADVINAIYRHELGLTDSDIDEASFTAVNTRLYYSDSYNYAGQVLEEVNSRKLIDNLCKQCTARQFKRYDGAESLKVLDTSDPSDVDFDDDTILRDSFFCKRAPFEEVYNEYFVSYNKNQDTGEFQSIAYVKSDDNNLVVTGYGTTCEAECMESQSKYSFVNRFTIEADWIRDNYSAAYLIYEICHVQKGYLRHYKSEFDVFLKDGFPVELCDTITVDNGWLPASVNGSAKKWEVIGLIKKLMQAKIGIKAHSHDGD